MNLAAPAGIYDGVTDLAVRVTGRAPRGYRFGDPTTPSRPAAAARVPRRHREVVLLTHRAGPPLAPRGIR